MNKKFCYRKVAFYNEAYIGGTFIRSKNDKEEVLMYFFQEVHNDMEQLIKVIKKYKNDFKKDKKSLLDIYGVIILKIRFNRTSPLKKEFWTTKTKEEMVLDQDYRIGQYLKMLDDNKQGLYQIMVMPYHYEVKNKKWILTNWLPVLRTIKDEELGKIAVMSTGTQVDSSAKEMALYSIEWVKGYNLEKDRFVEKEKTDYDC